ncbi:CMTM4 [Branchiostoma lanceolatum]|uniref:CMTM4 protein n=1 Tax=Branchiostoma lanceolatum TaxID=7740 RepID=A0A8K0EHF3_BRALA|nr:CMTM4 [Branchiostoma lanceolatum]
MEQNGWGPPAVDLNFLKSGLGVLKIVQMILSLVGFIVAEITASPYNWEQMKAFEWISLIIFILTLAVFTIFLASWHKSEAVIRCNWPLVDFWHSALCTVLWSINLILGLISISWRYRLFREGGAIAGTDFCHSALCTVLWSINLILGIVSISWYWPGREAGAIVDTILAIISLLTFWATVRMSYRRWHLFSPTPTIPYHYQHLGTEPYS